MVTHWRTMTNMHSVKNKHISMKHLKLKCKAEVFHV